MPLRFIDHACLACQGAAKRAGVMGSDEAGVRLEARPDGPWLILDRDADRGWPALRLRLPPDSRHIYSVRGVLTRGAKCASDSKPALVASFLRRELGRQGISFDEKDRKRATELDADLVRIRISNREPTCQMTILQKRSGESVPAGARQATLQTDHP